MKTKPHKSKHSAKMKALVAQWRSSRKTQAEFCRETGIRTHTLSYWANRSVDEDEEPEELRFVEVNPAKRSAAQKYEIVMPSGIVIRVDQPPEPDFIKDLTQTLGGD